MGLTYETEVPVPVEEVFDWYARPGAMARLMPPWHPVRVISEADSLRDGSAVLGLPGGLRWVAQHDPAEYSRQHRFVDELTSGWLGSTLRWRHTHTFTATSPNRTRVRDEVETPVPEGILRPLFTYRHRQLAADLAAQQRARAYDPTNLVVAITGASGLVGSALAALLGTAGHTVIRLVRRDPVAPGQRRWDPLRPAADLLRDVDAVVHLAGEPIAGRFTDGHKRQIHDSRIEPTRRLAELAAASGLKTFVCASAIGYYGPDRGDEELPESTERGEGLLAELVEEWEGACAPAYEAGVRVVQLRTGIVQSPAGGVLRMLRPLFAAGLGGRIGDGKHWMAWIGIDDLADVYHRALLDPAMSGPVNAVAPQPVRNDEYTRTLARVLRRPAVIPVPAFGPRLLLGADGADEVAAASQRVLPQWLADHDHVFRTPGLESALRHVLGKFRGADEQSGDGHG